MDADRSHDGTKGRYNIILNSRFYPEAAIREAIEDFSGICNATMSTGRDGMITVILEQEETTDAPLDDEFCNYVLGISRNRDVV